MIWKGVLSKLILWDKEHPCPLSTNVELWRILEVYDFGFHYNHDMDMVLNFVTPLIQILAH